MRTSAARAGTGYAHPDYAQSLAEFGTPRLLANSNSWILERPIAATPYRDAMGCYPLFCCRDWSRLTADLEALAGELVSVTAVTDPFGAYDESCLRDCFRDFVLPFKEHFVVDLGKPPETFVHSHHRRMARQARTALEVEVCTEPAAVLDDWLALYTCLVDRHRIVGLRAFSRHCFARQLRVPGLVAFRARHAGATVAMLLWYVDGEIGYYHLGASNRPGYEARASFALFAHALEHFAQRGLRFLDLGGGAGIATGPESGLTRFKAGWASDKRTAFLCGRVFNQPKYAQLLQGRSAPAGDYFPAYRSGELLCSIG